MNGLWKENATVLPDLDFNPWTTVILSSHLGRSPRPFGWKDIPLGFVGISWEVESKCPFPLLSFWQTWHLSIKNYMVPTAAFLESGAASAGPHISATRLWSWRCCNWWVRKVVILKMLGISPYFTLSNSFAMVHQQYQLVPMKNIKFARVTFWGIVIIQDQWSLCIHENDLWCSPTFWPLLPKWNIGTLEAWSSFLESF